MKQLEKVGVEGLAAMILKHEMTFKLLDSSPSDVGFI
jgi:hypothetical protein